MKKKSERERGLGVVKAKEQNKELESVRGVSESVSECKGLK